MKTSTATRKLSMATALAAISASTVAVSQVEAAIIQVDPNTKTGAGLIDFSNVVVNLPVTIGNNYDDVFFGEDVKSTPSKVLGAYFAERFQGQSLSFRPPILPGTGQFDELSGTPINPLTLQVGAPNQNLNISNPSSFYSQVLSGLGPLEFPNLDAIGEGSIAVLFESDQSEFGFDLVVPNTGGTTTLNFFRRDGSLINPSPIVLSGTDSLTFSCPPWSVPPAPCPPYIQRSYLFKQSSGINDIRGVSIYNYDFRGIGIDNIIYNNLGPAPKSVPESASVVALLGIGALGAGLKLKEKFKP